MKKKITISVIAFFSMCFLSLNAQHTSKNNLTEEPIYFIKPFPDFSNNNLPTNEECYCYYYNDFIDYTNFISLYVAGLVQSLQNQWYTEQRSVLDEELIDRLGLDPDFSHNYSSDFLQQNFFKEAFSPSVSNRFLTDAKNTDIGASQGHLEEYKKTYIPRKLFQYAQNNSQYDFGGLTHNNKAIESMSFTEAQNLWNHYATINIDHEVDWRYHSARIQKINNMLAHQPIINPIAEYISFNNYIASLFNNHVNAQSLSNTVSVMTGYMIYQQQLNFLYSFPSQNHVFLNFGYHFYSPYANRVQIQNFMNNIIGSGSGTHDIGEPNMTPEEIMREYSMTSMNLGNKAARFYEDKDALREEAAKFQERNGYDGNSKNLVKRLAEFFEDEEPFMPNSYWNGTQSWGQDSDRPERLMNIRLSSQALNWEIGDFGRVLEVLGNFSELDELKGLWLREYLKNAPDNSFLNHFTNEELGRIFDFDYRGINYLGLRFSPWALERILEIEPGDNIYGWDLFLNPIKLQILQALAGGETVTFEDLELMAEFFRIKELIPDAKYENLVSLYDLLGSDKYAILNIDCNQIQNWQTLAQHTAPQSVLDKIENLPSSWANDFEIQSIDDAGGTMVNLDYFSVKIDTLPNNPTTNQQFTPDEFIDHIRRNINDFTEGSTFGPYCNFSSMCPTETALWNSDNPLGSIIYIDISGDDGVVALTEYTNSYWYFMTMNAPYAGNHPVSGTRQFGYETNSDGSYNFFVRGVDRIASNAIENAAYIFTLGDPFGAADDLWSSFQTKTNEFVNANNGSSIILPPVKSRPDWDDVKDVLRGTKPISDLGCN